MLRIQPTVHRAVLVSLLLAVMLLLAACGDNKQGGPSVAVIGQPAPEFTLVDLNGRTWSLAGLRGKVVFLNFWATWCPPCREEMPAMVRLRSMLAGKPFEMVTVLVNDQPEKARRFLAKVKGEDLPVLLDPQGTVGNAYGITGVPETYIIDRQGVLRKKYIGAYPWDSEGALMMLGEFLK
ncbi:MAG TPA: TlpA family protein disulfide reductase [Desulfobacterales bacterium]|nr:TlpA family protein disulfide reductase [Desulfobacterales bacterium]